MGKAGNVIVWGRMERTRTGARPQQERAWARWRSEHLLIRACRLWAPGRLPHEASPTREGEGEREPASQRDGGGLGNWFALHMSCRPAALIRKTANRIRWLADQLFCPSFCKRGREEDACLTHRPCPDSHMNQRLFTDSTYVHDCGRHTRGAWECCTPLDETRVSTTELPRTDSAPGPQGFLLYKHSTYIPTQWVDD